jgi:hypothetical protein
VRKKLLISLVLLALGLVAADLFVGARYIKHGMWGGWRPLPPWSAVMTPRQAQWLERNHRELQAGVESSGHTRFDAELGWVTRPGWRIPQGTISSNASAMRGSREYTEERPPGVVRIAAFGDSYTWCDEVSDAESWPVQLEARREGWEVLNLGVSGYGTDQALLRFRREGTWDAQVVVIGLLLENIGRNVNRYRPLWYPTATACPAKPRFVLRGDELELVPLPFETRAEHVRAVGERTVIDELAEHEYWGGPRLSWPLSRSSIARTWAGLRAYEARSLPALWRDQEGEPFRTTLALLETFHAEALAGGAEHAVVVVFGGRREGTVYQKGWDPYWRGLLDELDRRGIPWIDASWELSVDRGLDPHGSELYRGAHLGPDGNAVVASSVGDWVADRLGVQGR